jgi:hypothetical protein
VAKPGQIVWLWRGAAWKPYRAGCAADVLERERGGDTVTADTGKRSVAGTTETMQPTSSAGHDWLRRQIFDLYCRRGGQMGYDDWEAKLNTLHRLEDEAVTWKTKHGRALCDWPRYAELVALEKELHL